MSEMPTTRPGRRKKTLVHKVVTVPGNFRQACNEFNSGRFFDCHETLEEIWQQEQGAVRDLYKGLIQIAAAYVHVTRPNHYGAERLCRTALGYLEPYRREGAMGFDVERICRDAESMYARVAELGRERIGEFDPGQRPFYEFDETKLPDEARRWNAWGFDTEGNALEMEIAVIE